MAALTKAEMAERLYEELGLNKREAKEMVEAFFDEIRGALSHNEQVKLSDLVTLICVTRNSGRDGTRRPVRKFRSVHGVLLRSARDKN